MSLFKSHHKRVYTNIVEKLTCFSLNVHVTLTRSSFIGDRFSYARYEFTDCSHR
jgi:hypothetical protein